LEDAVPVLNEEGIICKSSEEYEVGKFEYSLSPTTISDTVTILTRNQHYVIAMKPPSVVCHHSDWTGPNSNEIPMLQRVRDAIHSIDGGDIRIVNLVHRLDRGASGALLFAFANDDDVNQDIQHSVENDASSQSDNNNNNNNSNNHHHDNEDDMAAYKSSQNNKGPTAQLIDAMASPHSKKTYVAIVRGEGILHSEDLKNKGWFEVNRPIKDENGQIKDATTMFRFIAGQPQTDDGQPRVSLVLARPQHGRWHQIRRHLNIISSNIG
jgi:23S rRNA-/tRNA-specific pseudouridylate synthase